jgi:predicted phage terminase large subunit-like protein
MQTPEYQKIFAGVKIAADAKAAGQWNTNKGGEFYAIGVGGALAGRGGHLIVVDDPLSEQDIKAGNTGSLDATYEWFSAGLRTRLMPGGKIVVLHTRWHSRDVIGRLVKDAAMNPEADQYEVFEFPAILNENTPEEKSLWPEQWTLEALQKTKASMPLWQWNAQYQQALALHTPVPTPTGWTTMGELKVGDYVLSADGTPVLVTWKSPVYKDRPTYYVETDDGASVQSDEDHLWEIQTMRADGPRMVKTTKWMYARQEKRATKGVDKRRPRIRQSDPWTLPEVDLPIDPYVLGAWLGDGTSSSAQFTSSDTDAVWWAAEFERRGYGLKAYSKKYSYQIPNAIAGLRAAGVIGNKHIPMAYLRASRAQRLAVLQGLMDTDGHCSRGQAQFANTNLELIRGVEQLVLSLGGKPCTVSFEPTAGGFSKARGKTCYKVQFYLEDAFRMPRKAEHARNKLTKHGRFVTLRPAPNADTVCIRVANPDGLFLAGERCLVTHNCPTAAESAIIKRDWIRWWPKSEPPPVDFIIQSWDTALTTKERSDWSVCQTWGVWENESDGSTNLILLNSAKGKWEFPDLKQEAHEQYTQWQPDSVIIEAKASGQPLIDEMRRSGIFVQDFSPGKGQDKIARLNAVADMFSAGHVWFPETSWANDVVEEVLAFPSGEHDDQTDALTLALRRARTGGLLRLNTDHEDNESFPTMRRKGAYTV